jgi:valyl-tRNA synthetase
MEKTYNPQTIEQQWYQTWEKAGYFKASGNGVPYCIMLPPPNVTGTLHMGHGFQTTLMDVLIRYHRMCGANTLWQVGTDHAGIATQMVVERKLLQEGLKRHDIGRQAFEERVWEWKGQSDGAIKQQLRRMGVSTDWSRERFTMDPDICEAVQEVFIKLYEEGLIYRGKYLVNWDPVLLTAISDLEVVSQEEDGYLWHIRYPLVGRDDHLIVATTRPETLFGDTAVAVHPDDIRYQHLVGRQLHLPLTDRIIPIISDTFVDKEFGTGCVKITPAHDFNDYAVAQRHKLPIINIFTPNAHLNDNVPAEYRGLERFHARGVVEYDLGTYNYLEDVEPYKLQVPHGDRSNAVIEPYLTDQWYVKIKPLAEPAIEAVKKGEIEFVPENWNKIYFQWLENIEDWCISRQLWWGHRIPAWYDENGNVYIGRSESEVRQKHQLAATAHLSQDEDVLDTWFSAALWPFATLGWPEKTPELATFYPTNVLVTGFDIIFFWVARMIMMGLKFNGKVPFQKVYIHGLIRDNEGQKMSKSKGNILDPIDLIQGIDLESLVAKRTYGLMQPDMLKKIEKATRQEFAEGIPAFGTDALRFTYCALATPGRDIRFDLARIAGYRNFCNKLWNAARYVLMNTEGQDVDIHSEDIILSLADRWITSCLQKTIRDVKQALQDYRFDLLAQAIYEFVWNEYCDWYLELSKAILFSSDSTPAQLRGARKTLLTVLETVLRLIHPLMPFLSEEIWQKVAPLAGKEGATIMLQPYPIFIEEQVDGIALSEIKWLKDVILGVRNIRGEMNISPSKPLPLLLRKGSPAMRESLIKNQLFLKSLAKLSAITWLEDNIQPPAAATALVEDLELLIPMAGLIDKDAEIARLTKEINKLQKELERAEHKLSNANYVQKAPADVVEKERNRVLDLITAIDKLNSQLENISNYE